MGETEWSNNVHRFVCTYIQSHSNCCTINFCQIVCVFFCVQYFVVYLSGVGLIVQTSMMYSQLLKKINLHTNLLTTYYRLQCFDTVGWALGSASDL